MPLLKSTQPIRHRKGSSLIELLVVIVIFLIGVLAMVQIFPLGLNVIQRTRAITQAENLARAELERIQGQSGYLPEMIVPVTYNYTVGGVVITVNPNRLTTNLMPDQGVAGGDIDANGNVLINGNPIGNWALVSGSNLYNRVIGEGQPVPGPRRLNNGVPGLDFGSLMTLRFAPIYDDGSAGVFTVYGNDYQRNWGDRSRGFPSPGRTRDYEFYFVDANNTDDENFVGEDQIWIAPAQRVSYRVTFSFNYDDGVQTGQYEVIIPITLDPLAPPPFARIGTDESTATNYWVISLPQLVGQPDINGNTNYVPANYRDTDWWSVRVQRQFERLNVATPFGGDPYQFKVLSPSTGQILINPQAASTTVPTRAGRAPLFARTDYTVYDWRLIRDEFRVPTQGPVARKLVINGIMPRSGTEPDGRNFAGLGLSTPDVTGTVGSQDFILFDVETGGVILGNESNNPNAPGFPQSPNSAYSVDKTNGYIEFRDVDNTNPDLSAFICYPTGNNATPWTAPVLVDDISGRNVRALYRGQGAWSVQPFKAAAYYRPVYGFNANGLAPGEAFIGGTNSVGNNFRIYFPPSDLGQQVIIDEVWFNTGTGAQVLKGQEFQITAIEPGLNLAYADIRDKAAAGSVFDFSQGYAVRGIRGASMKVRVLWNPTFFRLVSDGPTNYARLEEWQRSYRRTETQSFAVRGTER